MLDARPQRVILMRGVERLVKIRYELVSGGVVERDAIDAVHGNAADAAAEEHDLPRIQDHVLGQAFLADLARRHLLQHGGERRARDGAVRRPGVPYNTVGAEN